MKKILDRSLPHRRGTFASNCKFTGVRTDAPHMSASLIGRFGSSAFRLSTAVSVDVARGLALLFGIGENEAEQSFGRPNVN
jgi:hypothetical protein